MDKKTRDKVRGKGKIMAPDPLRELDKKSLSKIKDDEREKLIEECFGDWLLLIKSKKIKDFVIEVLMGANPEFYTAPASSTGKHHPPENNVKGGLVVHTRNLFPVAKVLFESSVIKDQLLEDKVFAGCILHDVDKFGNPWGEKTDPKHGLIAKRRLIKVAAIESNPENEDFIRVDQDFMDIIELVSNHMGIYNKPEPTPALVIGEIITEKTICNVIVQVSDLVASRKWLSFKF